MTNSPWLFENHVIGKSKSSCMKGSIQLLHIKPHKFVSSVSLFVLIYAIFKMMSQSEVYTFIFCFFFFFIFFLNMICTRAARQVSWEKLAPIDRQSGEFFRHADRGLCGHWQTGRGVLVNFLGTQTEAWASVDKQTKAAPWWLFFFQERGKTTKLLILLLCFFHMFEIKDQG